MVAALTAGVCGQSQAPPAKTTGATTGTISGRVVSDSGQPLADASLFVRPMNPFISPRTTSTDADGNFRLSGLESGLYSITANAPAYATDPTVTPTYYRLGDSVDLELIRGGVITGTVLNTAGEPVIGVRVRAFRVRDANGQSLRVPAAGYQERPTDDRGVYRLYGLLPGTYLVSAGGATSVTQVFNSYDTDVPTYSPSSTRDAATEIPVRSGEESAADIRYRGEQGYSISGVVKVGATDGASVTLRAAGNPTPLSLMFQTPGRGFAFSGLADGEYILRAQESVSGPALNTAQLGASVTRRIIIKGADVTGLELIPIPLASISGRIVLEPSTAPACQEKRPPLLTEMLVQLQRPEKDVKDEDGIYVGPVGASASPDASGNLIWRNVRPGKYRFDPRFYERYWYLQSITMTTKGAKPQKIDTATTWTTIKSGDRLSNVTITLAKGAASFRGRLTLAEGATVQHGINLYLIPAEPDKATDVLRYFVNEVLPDGTFAFRNVPPGKYLALIQANVDESIATQPNLREPEASAARVKLRRTAETKKTEIELKPCQNITDYQVKP